MTIDSIQTSLQLVQEMAARKDFEAAHSYEDRLYREFVEYVFKEAPATSLYELRLMAKEILRSKRIEFPRDCT